MATSPKISMQQFRIQPWLDVDGDNTLRMDYKLDPSSIVFDVGGYLGDWTAKVFDKFGCEIYVFEPVSRFYEELIARFAGNSKIHLFNFGLAGKSRTEQIALLADSASVFKQDSSSEQIKLVDISEFLADHGIKKIDMMEINIEGGEYELLERMIDTGVIKLVQDMQIQFHDFIDNAEDRMLRIQKRLRETHYTTFHYKFIWENWRIRPKIDSHESATQYIHTLEKLQEDDTVVLDQALDSAMLLRQEIAALKLELRDLHSQTETNPPHLWHKLLRLARMFRRWKK